MLDERLLKRMKRGIAYAMLGSMITIGAGLHPNPAENVLPMRTAAGYSVMDEGPAQTRDGPGLDPASPAQLYSSGPPAACLTDSQLEDTIAALKRSTVLVDTATGLGSGVIIAHRDGRTVILTNRHVVEAEGAKGKPQAEEGIVVHNDGAEAKAERVLVAPDGIDLAIVIVKGDLGPDARLANATIRRGTGVVAIGSPLGIEDSATRGIVSNFVERTSDGGFKFVAIQTDAAINPGNSGGGLFLAGTGELLGITTFKLKISPFETAEGMSFVIPINVFTQFPLAAWSELQMHSHSGTEAASASPGPNSL